MAKRKQVNPLQSAVARIVAKINLNTIVLALITALFGYLNVRMDGKQDETIEKQKQQATWMAKRDSINRITFAKLDSILTIIKHKK